MCALFSPKIQLQAWAVKGLRRWCTTRFGRRMVQEDLPNLVSKGSRVTASDSVSRGKKAETLRVIKSEGAEGRQHERSV